MGPCRAFREAGARERGREGEREREGSGTPPASRLDKDSFPAAPFGTHATGADVYQGDMINTAAVARGRKWCNYNGEGSGDAADGQVRRA